MQNADAGLAERLEGLVLGKGQHTFGQGNCANEAVAWLAWEVHSDAPKCVCPVIRKLVLRFNDAFATDEERTLIIKPVLLAMIDTRSTPEVETKRRYLLVDWCIRDNAPAYLDRAGLTGHATKLRNPPEIDSDAATHAAVYATHAAVYATHAAVYAAADAVYAATHAAYAAAAYAAAADVASEFRSERLASIVALILRLCAVKS